MEWFAKFISEHWGDVASVAGLIVSVVGFAITIYGVRKSRTAAQQAAAAAQATKNVIFRVDTIMELSAAIAMLDEIRRLHRANTWQIVPDRYYLVREKLILIRATNPHLAEQHQADLLGAIQQIRNMENKVERALATESSTLNGAKLNDIILTQIDKLNEVLNSIRKEAGIEQYAGQKSSRETQIVNTRVSREN